MEMLQHCWDTCEKFFKENFESFNEEQKRFVDIIGSHVHKDAFGNSHAVCDLRKGWTSNARKNFIANTVIANASFNSDQVRRYDKDKIGVLKTRVPEELWKKILAFYSKAKFVQGFYLLKKFVDTVFDVCRVH